MANKSKPTTFRPTQENLEILNRKVNNSIFDKAGFINYLIESYHPNLAKMQELEQANRTHERIKNANEFAGMSMYKDEKLAKEGFEKQLKTAIDKIEKLTLQSNTDTAEIEQLKQQSAKSQERVEILKSKNEFLNAQKSVLDKSTLNELETLRAKVAEQEKEVFNLTAKVGCYENEYLTKAFAEVKGSKLMVKDDGENETFIIDTKFELVRALSYKYCTHLFND
jgi:hypothetical protein